MEKNNVAKGYEKALGNYVGTDDSLVQGINLAIERGINTKPFVLLLTKDDEMALYPLTDENSQVQPCIEVITNYCKLQPIVWIGVFKIRLCRVTDELSSKHVADRTIFLQRLELDQNRLLMNRVMACDVIMSDDSKEVMPLGVRSMMGMTCRPFPIPVNMADLTLETVMNAWMIEHAISPNVH
jgi:hypothetical protein